MAKFKPYKILESQLDSLPIKEGQFILTTDTKKLYSDTAANTRILISPDAITNLSVNGTTVTYTRLDGTTGTITTKDTTYSVASETKNGLMSADDKAKLNAIESGAQKNTITGVKGDSESLYRTGNVNITKANIGLGNVENKTSATIRGELTNSNVTTALGYTPLNSNLKGANNGLAELDASGKVPASQLPSYVDDVLEYSAKANFPTTGETGKIYVDTSNNKTYRWGGSAYAEISESIALGTTSSTAFRGDYGNTAYQHANKKGSEFYSGFYKIGTNAEGHVTSATSVTKEDITNLGIPAQDTTYGVATSSVNGLMSSDDKNKLLNIEAGAQKNKVHGVKGSAETEYRTGNINITKANIGLGNVENKSSATIRSELTKADVTAALGYTPPTQDTNTTYENATTNVSGLMSGSDKYKLDNIEDGAQKNTILGVKGSAETDYRTGYVNIYKDDIGLAYVDNTADVNKSVKYAKTAGDAETVNGLTVETAVPANAKFTDSNTTYTFATGDANGQIKVTPSSGNAQNVSVKGLGSLAYKSSLNASDVGAIASTLKGAVNGVAELDSSGKVPTAQLPSYVDDVLEYTAKANFPTTGETGKIYVDTTTNKTYRWSGSAYVEISSSLALGTTSSTAYRGDYGNTAYTHATDSNRLTTATSSGLYKVASTAQGHIASLTAVTKADITGLGIPGSDTNTTYTFATGDSNGQIKVTPSGGSAQNVSVKGLAAGAYKAVDTSISAASTSTNLPTSAAVASFVEGKGYKTTDNNTTYTFATGSSNGTISVTPSGGSAQNVSVKGLAAAAYKGVDTSMTKTSTSTNVPTTKAVADLISAEMADISVDGVITSSNETVENIVSLTKAEYEALETKESNTLYHITDDYGENDLLAADSVPTGARIGYNGTEAPEGYEVISTSKNVSDNLPVGSGMDYFGTEAPYGYLFADGSAISRTEYAELFAIIGTTYGSGDGSTTFNLPDKRSRVSVMKDSGTFNALGKTGGAETVTLTTAQMPSHTHVQNSHNHTFTGSASSFSGSGNLKRGDYTVVAADANGGATWRYILKGGTGLSTYSDFYSISVSGSVTAKGTISDATATNQDTGGGQAHNNLQPYLVCNYIIKAKNTSTYDTFMFDLGGAY